MDDTKTDNQVINGNDADASGATQPQYTETERQLYTRLKKEEATVKELKARLGEKASQDSQPTSVSDSDWRERMEIRLTHGINEESELDFIMRNGGRKAIENDPYVKGAIQKRKEEADAADKVAFNTSPKSPVEKRYSQTEIQSMSVTELEAAINGGKVR